MSKHTQGPWRYKPSEPNIAGYSHGFSVFAGEVQLTKGGCGGCSCRLDDESIDNEADARLMAAAPELLSVLLELKECSEYWSEYDVPIGIHSRIDAAIAKATGGTQ